ncbi:Baculoviral IAP repeat-containing protein 2 [Symbiodinium microadriaticum]|uniref:Baculoviral IAP repeat-containing protein 2 n=1 Tax=Symbiodinium microadriaticum TaxID=2951 RepID=A0A1Q9DPJ4_SYMMI|nr:Baculoviral IAP repeat-containing protein 2 [Symbiodinium microadriaticum]CAE7251698.1 Birc2 [Symbiodinium microadriaticum]
MVAQLPSALRTSDRWLADTPGCAGTRELQPLGHPPSRRSGPHRLARDEWNKAAQKSRRQATKDELSLIRTVSLGAQGPLGSCVSGTTLKPVFLESPKGHFSTPVWESRQRVMVWYSYGNALNALSLAISSLAYNRDTFADSIALQQNQMYQEKNYHITWIASVREEMRDFLTIFVGKLQNTGVLNTLLFGISTAFLCEGELDSEAPESLVYAYYGSLIVSMLYFGCSILFCFIGVSSAYAESKKFLLKFVPDVHDAYNFDYISQLLEWEGKGEALRVPFAMESSRLAEKKERQRRTTAGTQKDAADPDDFYERFDGMMRDFNEPTKLDYLHKGGTNTRFWGVSPTSAECDEEMADTHESSFYEVIGRYNLLWEPCSLASHDSMMLGVFALCQSFAYFLIGRHMDRSLRDRLGMYTTMTIAGLAFAGRLSRLLTVQSEQSKLEVKNREEKHEDCIDRAYKLKHWVLKLLMLLGPAMVTSGVFLSDEMLLIAGYVLHGSLHGYLAFFLVRSFPSLPKQKGLPPPWEEKLRRLAGKGYGSRKAESEPGLEARASPEPLLRQLLFESEKKSVRTTIFMKRLLLKSHIMACLPWAWLTVGALHDVAVEADTGSEVSVTEVNVTWASHAFFSARSMTCAQGGQVWLASDDGVFAIARGADGGGVESTDCPALPFDEKVQDVSTSCSEFGCWPAVLGASGRLYSCNPNSEGAITPFKELSGISGFAVAAGEGFYARKNNSILHFPSRKSVAPPLPGLVGFDLLPNAGGEDLFLFSAGRAASIQLRSAATGELRKWALPAQLPPLRAACALTPTAVLAAMQDPSSEDHPSRVIKSQTALLQSCGLGRFTQVFEVHSEQKPIGPYASSKRFLNASLPDLKAELSWSAFGVKMVPKAHHCLDWLSEATASLVLVRHDDEELEELREDLLKRRDTAIVACALEILVSVASMALYDIRRSIIVPIANSVLAVLASYGLVGALALQLPKIQVHGVVTTGLLVACLVNFLCEALLTHAGLGTDTLPGWLVLLFLFVPYSINLACSILSLMLGQRLSEFLDLEDDKSGLLSDAGLAEQAQLVAGEERCCACMERRKDAVITPCGHRAVCMSCATILKARGRKCPICRQTIDQVIRVFDS